MSASIADVATQFRDVIERIDRAAVAALGASTDTEQAGGLYNDAAVGSSHPRIRAAITNTREGSAKTAKVARLLAESANAFTDYLNAIAPGTAPARQVSGGSVRTGAQIVEDSATKSRTGFGRFVQATSARVDDLSEIARNVAKAIDPDRGGSGTAAARTVPVAALPSTDVPDAAANLVVIAIAGAVVAKKLAELARRRHDNRDDQYSEGDR